MNHKTNDSEPVKTTSRNKYDESGIPISKMEDYQTSMSTFSTRLESKVNGNLSDLKEKLNKIKDKKKVEFNPLITVINIESYKKENYYVSHGTEPNNDSDNVNKRCILCTIF